MSYFIHIRQHERSLLFDRGDFVRLLGPGRHFLPVRMISGKRAEVQVFDTLKPRFEHPMLEVLARNAEIREAMEIIELADEQRAIVWKDGRALCILGAGLHAFWKTAARLSIEPHSIESVESLRFSHPKLPAILQLPEATRYIGGVKVDAGETVLLYRDGVLIDRLGEGLHCWWTGNGHLTWKTVSLREQTLDVAGQEIITADKVSLRVNLLVTFTVADPVKAVSTTVDYGQALYRDAQLALRAAIGTRTLDALLADKESAGAELSQAVAKRATELGLSVVNVGLRDIILPGDMKALLNQVISATKEAEANLIRRREETAAVRSQANTARLLAENPHLLRLRELEALQNILAGAKTTFVLGPGDLAGQVKALVSSQSQ